MVAEITAITCNSITSANLRIHRVNITKVTVAN